MRKPGQRPGCRKYLTELHREDPKIAGSFCANQRAIAETTRYHVDDGV
jgi:hypothetical protein